MIGQKNAADTFRVPVDALLIELPEEARAEAAQAVVATLIKVYQDARVSIPEWLSRPTSAGLS